MATRTQLTARCEPSGAWWFPALQRFPSANRRTKSRDITNQAIAKEANQKLPQKERSLQIRPSYRLSLAGSSQPSYQFSGLAVCSRFRSSGFTTDPLGIPLREGLIRFGIHIATEFPTPRPKAVFVKVFEIIYIYICIYIYIYTCFFPPTPHQPHTNPNFQRCFCVPPLPPVLCLPFVHAARAAFPAVSRPSQPPSLAREAGTVPSCTVVPCETCEPEPLEWMRAARLELPRALRGNALIGAGGGAVAGIRGPCFRSPGF